MKESLLSRSWIGWNNSLSARSWTDERILGWVVKTFYYGEINQKTTQLMKHVFVKMDW